MPRAWLNEKTGETHWIISEGDWVIVEEPEMQFSGVVTMRERVGQKTVRTKRGATLNVPDIWYKIYRWKTGETYEIRRNGRNVKLMTPAQIAKAKVILDNAGAKW